MPIRRNYEQNWLPSFFNDFFDNDWMAKANATAPAINVAEDKTEYRIEVAVPGMTKDDFRLQLTKDNQLVISMEKKSETNDKDDKDKRYLRREFSYSKFQQSMILPDDVEKERISASVNDGVLTIDLPKKTAEEKEQECRMIEIK